MSTSPWPRNHPKGMKDGSFGLSIMKSGTYSHREISMKRTQIWMKALNWARTPLACMIYICASSRVDELNP